MDPHTSTQGRDACHAARDAFYACVDQQPLAPDAASAEQARRAALEAPACAAPRAAFDAACLASWRSYWSDRYARGRPILGRKQ